MMKLAFIGDNSNLVYYLRSIDTHFDIVNIVDIKSYLSLGKLVNFDKILWFVPKINKTIFMACQAIKQINFSSKIMIITSKLENSEWHSLIAKQVYLVNGFNENAEDRKSILNFLHLNDHVEESLVKINDEIVLNLDTQTLITKNEMTLLPGKEFELICYFLKNKGKFVTVDQILLAVWDEFSTPENVRQYIYKLRKKLEKCKTNSKVIVHKKGVGYLLLDNSRQKFNQYILS